VQTFAGHSSLQVTMDPYGHLFKSDDHKKTMDAIAEDIGYYSGYRPNAVSTGRFVSCEGNHGKEPLQASI
jgi:hypothetical protein